MKNFFQAQRVAVIGASKEEGKVGNVIFQNFLSLPFKGEVFAVNPNAQEVMGYPTYKNVRDIDGKIDLAVIAVPAKFAIKAVEDCGKKKIRNVIIITAGFKEVGNYKLDNQLQRALEKHKIKCIGPNCLGIYSTYGIDTLFLPRTRLKRPKPGTIAFVSQSGASGSAILDLAAEEGYGFSKFISYGNAMNVNETDLIEYLGEDPETKVICLYVEGILDGRRFLEVCKKVSKKKTIIAIKGGTSKKGSEATMSHTGSLAGQAEVYFGAFKQAGIITAHNLEEMFDYLRIFEKVQIKPKGKRIQVITNGGGYGILCTDAIETFGLEMAEPHSSTLRALKKKMPKIAVVKNPTDILGDADIQRYIDSITAYLKDNKVDIILAVVLPQTPLIGQRSIVDSLEKLNKTAKKPLITVTTGSEYAIELRKQIEEKGIPCFEFPHNAVRAIQIFIEKNK
ncbi:CoA-binding protein [Candidatus Woesearchaeota archaeon]|nr:CoA-binding protein [Candidatus Woesearchaeota archaeon]